VVDGATDVEVDVDVDDVTAVLPAPML